MKYHCLRRGIREARVNQRNGILSTNLSLVITNPPTFNK